MEVISIEDRDYRSENGYPAEPDLTVKESDPKDFDGVVIPGGRECPDKLRREEAILDFVQEIHGAGDLVAAICHAGWVPASAEILKGHTATCYHSIKDDIRNAGANYVDREVVVSDNLITSRHPGDLPSFLKEILGFLR